MKKTLLINHVYYSPVGHMVEVLKLARGFKEANPDLEIHVAVNEGTSLELAEGAPWIKKVYPVNPYGFLKELRKPEQVDFTPFIDDHSSLECIPKEWDYVMTDERAVTDAEGRSDLWMEEEGMVHFHTLAKEYFIAREGKGSTFHTRVLPEGLSYNVDAQVRLDVPRDARKYAEKYKKAGLRICVLPGGSAQASHYPSVESWITILSTFSEEVSDLQLYFTGVHRTANNRTDTRAYTKEEIVRLVTETGGINCFDIGLWNQVAVMEMSDVFISPHSGFAFLAPCVGAPWLALSGGPWPEYFFNQVPFYSVLPDNPEYPYMHEFNEENHLEKIPSMQKENLQAKIPEIVGALRLLTDSSFTYIKAMERHLENIEHANVRKERIPKKPGF